MSTAIAEADHRTGIGNQLRNAILVGVEQCHRKLDPKVVFQSQIEEGINPVTATLAGYVSDAPADQRLEGWVLHFLDFQPLPFAIEDRWPLQRVAEIAAEFGVAIDFLLYFARLIEDRVPAIEIGKDKGIAKIDLNRQRAACHLR